MSAPPARYYAAYLPVPDERCAHHDLVNSVTDRGIDLGPNGQLVSVPITGRSPLPKIMCKRCGRAGGFLPAYAEIDGRRLNAVNLPPREAVRPPREHPERTGIPTTYHGTNFRSRLEARWAAFFDLAGWSWVYEPFDLEGYIPDFLMTSGTICGISDAPLLVEVGPCSRLDEYRAKAQKWLDLHDSDHALLVLGVSPALDVWSDHRRMALGWKEHWLLGVSAWVEVDDPRWRVEQQWNEAGNRVQWRAA